VVLWINTKDYEDTYRTPGIGPRPFAVLTGNGGRFAYVNNAGGDKVSVIDMASKAVIGTLITGQQPIVMREFDGKIYVTNEVAGTLNIITPPVLP
jgi:YVTN family beta-propeller protein